MRLITDTQTVSVFAQDFTVHVTVTACALVTVLCYLCISKCPFIITVVKPRTICRIKQSQHLNDTISDPI